MTMSPRERVLNLFSREKIDYIPVFSGQGNISLHGLAEHDWNFPDIHSDARKMATAAASTYRLFGFECAVVPFDVGVEAEALGSKLNYYPNQKDILSGTLRRILETPTLSGKAVYHQNSAKKPRSTRLLSPPKGSSWR